MGCNRYTKASSARNHRKVERVRERVVSTNIGHQGTVAFFLNLETLAAEPRSTLLSDTVALGHISAEKTENRLCFGD